MNATRRTPLVLAGLAFLGLALLAGRDAGAQDKDKPAQPAAPKKVEIGKNVVLEIDGDKRRVLVNAVVCQRMVQLEQFMCRKMTKEHEAIVAADVDAKHIHAALLGAGAEAGSPVKFRPKYTPATGCVIKVYVQYEEKGKTVKVPAQEWVRNAKSKKVLEHDWVFAGSALYRDPQDPTRPPYYAANDGDVICLANFDTALLDLPVASTQDNDDLVFEANTDRIPALGTQVVIILEPVLPAKKK